MIRIFESERKVIPSSCAMCGYYTIPGAEDFCDECGNDKLYEIVCPTCKSVQARLGHTFKEPSKCLGCSTVIPSHYYLMRSYRFRILYHKGIKNEERQTIH